MELNAAGVRVVISQFTIPQLPASLVSLTLSVSVMLAVNKASGVVMLRLKASRSLLALVTVPVPAVLGIAAKEPAAMAGVARAVCVLSQLGVAAGVVV